MPQWYVSIVEKASTWRLNMEIHGIMGNGLREKSLAVLYGSQSYVYILSSQLQADGVAAQLVFRIHIQLSPWLLLPSSS